MGWMCVQTPPQTDPKKDGADEDAVVEEKTEAE